MSVQQIDLKVLNEFGARLVTIAFRTQWDEWYAYSIKEITEKGVHDSIDDIVKEIANMNAINYSMRYSLECESLAEFIKIGNGSISIYQFLKTLKYIIYNTCDYIECFSRKQRKIFDFLEKLEHEISANIINTLPEYIEAKWSTV